MLSQLCTNDKRLESCVPDSAYTVVSMCLRIVAAQTCTSPVALDTLRTERDWYIGWSCFLADLFAGMDDDLTTLP